MTAVTMPAEPEVGAEEPPDRQAERLRRAAVKAATRRVLRPVAGPLLGAGILQGLASIAAVAPFVLVVELARNLLAGDTDPSRTWTLGIWALALLGVRGILSALALLWTHLMDADYQFSLREQLAYTLARVPLGWFGERSSGAVNQSLQDDVHALHYLIAHARLDLVGAVTVPAVSLAYLFWVDWRLALVLLVPLVIYLIALTRMTGGHGSTTMSEYADWERRVQATVVEFVDGIQVVRTFGQAGRAHRRFQEAVDGFSAFFAAWAGPITRLESATNVLLTPAFMLLLSLAAGIGMVGAGWVEPVSLLPFILVGVGLGATVLNIGFAAQASRQAAGAAVRVAALLDEPPLPTTPRPTAPSPLATDTVVFDSVGFGYHAGQHVLEDVSFTLRPGTITALVGASGSGKSTVAKLLPRFYDVTAGSVSVQGVDVRQIDPTELYRLVGFVFQDVRLVRGTIADNIALGRPGIARQDIERVARAAQIHDRITQLPAGYDARVGIDVRLSGGEAQRLSIARALLADPPILVLDEATAFADPESEGAIQNALSRLVAGRTVLVIAHRLHTVTDVDTILVLDRGHLVERGRHADLLAAGGVYRRLWDANESAARALAGDQEQVR